MALVVGTNSYLSVADADAWLADAFDTEAWASADAATKSKALIAATAAIDALPLVGRKVDTDATNGVANQRLQFPRKVPASYGWLEQAQTPAEVLQACALEAAAILTRRASPEDTQRASLQAQGVTSFSLGSLNESYEARGGGPGRHWLVSQDAYRLLRQHILTMAIANL